jgi:predicted enzyme related to lactoylglutathione lyase
MYQQGRGLEIGYVNIWVENVPRSVEFYEKIGLRKRFYVDTADGGFAEFGTEAGGAGSDAGSVRLCIAGMKEAQRLFGKTKEKGSVNFTQIVLVYNDVERVYHAAIAAGGKAVNAPAPGPCWGTTIARFQDPDGYMVSLLTRMSPQQAALRLYELAGPTAFKAMKHPDKASELSLDGLPRAKGSYFKPDPERDVRDGGHAVRADPDRVVCIGMHVGSTGLPGAVAPANHSRGPLYSLLRALLAWEESCGRSLCG